jgi:hypothetical protein
MSAGSDPSRAMEWVRVSDASMRIEAILSGQAVIVATSEPSAAQPVAARVAETASYLTPIPHTVVVVRQRPFTRRRTESRARRVGRISRQFIVTTGDEDDEPSGRCCTIFSSMYSPKPSTRSGPLSMC